MRNSPFLWLGLWGDTGFGHSVMSRGWFGTCDCLETLDCLRTHDFLGLLNFTVRLVMGLVMGCL